MVKQIIKEAMEKNPIGLKEAVAEELRARVALVLGAKTGEMSETVDLISEIDKSKMAELDRLEKEYDMLQDRIDKYIARGVQNYKNTTEYKKSKEIGAKIRAIMNESVDLEEAITAQNKKDAESVIAYAKQNRGWGVATTAGDNSTIPNIQIVRYLESIGKVKNVKELPSGKGWRFELKESVDLEEAKNPNALDIKIPELDKAGIDYEVFQSAFKRSKKDIHVKSSDDAIAGRKLIEKNPAYANFRITDTTPSSRTK
jgi:hypothetical protein